MVGVNHYCYLKLFSLQLCRVENLRKENDTSSFRGKKIKCSFLQKKVSDLWIKESMIYNIKHT